MLDSMYTEALRKKDSINRSIDDYFDESEIDIESKWKNEKITPSDDNLILAAGDGSFNKKKYLGFNFYAVSAESLIYNPNESKLDTIETVEVDVLTHQKFIDDRLRNMMSIFEIKTALKALKEYDIDYYMDDGSILGDLIRPIPIEIEIPPKERSQIMKIIYDKLKKEVETSELEISSSKFEERFKDLFEDKTNRERYSLLTFLESIEHLIGLKQILNNKKKIIAISKTSTSNDIFHANIPDMAILDKFTRDEGYSEIIYKKVTSQVKHDFPVSDTFFKDQWFTIFFARLEKNKNIIKIELPYHAREEQIKEILAILKANSTEGYPFLLKRAHNDVVIKHNDINSLSNIIEFIDKSGREMLD
ncbi:MAG: DNA double-strand break repair nuclease NurA [Methanobrevibacter sp.]|nr:DNA double-strand break repair nuclease NurA [Methanobrevibacter sp.]